MLDIAESIPSQTQFHSIPGISRNSFRFRGGCGAVGLVKGVYYIHTRPTSTPPPRHIHNRHHSYRNVYPTLKVTVLKLLDISTSVHYIMYKMEFNYSIICFERHMY
jgi:hypothetical protein